MVGIDNFISRHMWRRLLQFQKVMVHCLEKFVKDSKLIVFPSLFVRFCIVKLNHSCEEGQSLSLHGGRENVTAAFMIPYNVGVCCIEFQCCM